MTIDVRRPDRRERRLVGGRIGRLEVHALERLGAHREPRLTRERLAGAVDSVELDVGERGRVDVPACRQVLLGVLDRLGKRPGQIGERRKHQIAERVAGKPLAVREAVLEEARLQAGLVLGHRHEAVADVAGRQHAELAAQHARRAAVVGHGDDGARLEAEREQAVDDRRQAGAAADGDGPAAGADAHRTARSRPMSRWPTTAR